MRISRKSIMTGRVNEMDLAITHRQIDRWQSGELIQNVMPNLDDDEREFLMTGIIPEEWNQCFGGNDDS